MIFLTLPPSGTSLNQKGRLLRSAILSPFDKGDCLSRKLLGSEERAEGLD